MKNSYQPILLNKITDEVVIKILNVVIPMLNQLQINYFVVGAFARDLDLLAKGFQEPPARKTNDIDLAIMVSNEAGFDNLKSKILELNGFTSHPTEPIKFIFEERYELDVLPFGDIENEKGEVELKAKKVFTLNMPGFAEVFSQVNSIKTEAVSARFLGRKIGEMLQNSPKLLKRIQQLLLMNINDTNNSPIGKLMAYKTLEEAIAIIHQLYLGITDKNRN